MNIRVITVSREFGSGGRTIARMIANSLGINYYDGELVTKIAKESGLAEEFIQESGEYACTTNEFFFNISNCKDSSSPSLSDQLFVIQNNIISDLAQRESCVIVGRCADFILKERKDCLHTFFHADMAFRAKRITQLYGETKHSPFQRLEEKDKKRSVYYKYYTGKQWGLAQNYHISLNTGVVGINQCAEFVVNIVKNAHNIIL
ncbi:MAG: cytidylate kinase-like family protein [Synergistaceae bacterium]|jgi:cytidylate kinase|nr:cytidylate kinase-like family protein [Synergistaceae bacterium]